MPSCSIGFCVASTKNGSSQLVRRAADGDRCSCIASSSADCVLGVARLISSARTMLAKIGPALELEHSRRPSGVFVDDVRADDVGRHQVGRELDALEVQVQRLGERADQQRLAQPGHAFEQRVAAGEQAGQHAVDDLVVADDHLADLRLQALIPRPNSAALASMSMFRCSGVQVFRCSGTGKDRSPSLTLPVLNT